MSDYNVLGLLYALVRKLGMVRGGGGGGEHVHVATFALRRRSVAQILM